MYFISVSKNKKGLFGWDSTLTAIIAVVVFVVLLIIAGRIFLQMQKNTPDQLCSTSAFVTSTTSIAGKTTFDFKCPVRQWAFDVGKYGEIALGDIEPKQWISASVSNPRSLKWYQPFTGPYKLDGTSDGVKNVNAFSQAAVDNAKANNGPQTNTKDLLMDNMENEQIVSGSLTAATQMRQDVYAAIGKKESTYMIMDQQDFMNGIITNRMYECIKKLGDGKLNLFSSWYTNYHQNSFCVVCDTFDFSRLASKDGLTNANMGNINFDTNNFPNYFFMPAGSKYNLYDEYPTVKTLDNWMRLWQPPNEGMNFFNYFLKFNTDDTYFNSNLGNNIQYTMFNKDANGNVVSRDYAIVYMEADDPIWMQAINSVITDNQKQKYILGGAAVGGAVGCLSCAGVGAAIGALGAGAGAIPGAAIGCVLCSVGGGAVGGVGGISLSAITNVFTGKTQKITKAHGIYFVPVDSVPNICDHIVNY